MFLGPVFHAELITTARRTRYYAMRAAYGLVLLGVLWSGYRSVLEAAEHQGGDELNVGEMSKFSGEMFRGFAIAQALMVVLLTPALVAPVIAAEKSRKTLPYLLASELTSAEIVLGKLGARLLQLSVLLGVGFPFVCLLSLFGAVDAELTLYTYGVTGSLLLFLAGESILVSVLAREPRAAIFYAYGVPGALLGFPLLLDMVFSVLGSPDASLSLGAYRWPMPHPGELLAFAQAGRLPAGFWPMSMTWAGIGLACILMASVLLRPVGRHPPESRRKEIVVDRKARWHWRILPRPPCGDDPMQWKERHTSRVGGWAKLAGVLFNASLIVLIDVFAYNLAWRAVVEWIYSGYGLSEMVGAREALNSFIRSATLILTTIWILGTAATAASSITSEREGDTWISLLSTPLRGDEIVRAKMLGAVMRFRWMGFMMGALWLLGLVVGAIHPLGVLVAIVAVPAYLGFAAALGMVCSLESRTTTRAIALAMVGLLALNGVFHMNTSATAGMREGLRGAEDMGVTPGFTAASLATYREFASLTGSEPTASSVYQVRYYEFADRETTFALADTQRIQGRLTATAVSVLISGLLAYALAKWAFVRFDPVADRPKVAPLRRGELPASERRRRLAT